MPRVLDATTDDEKFVFSYGVAPKKLRLSPESRSEIRRQLSNRLSRNVALCKKNPAHIDIYLN